MNSKPHRQNSNFQLKHFMANDCKTPDGAYVLLYGQRIDMENKIAVSVAQEMRRDARIMAANEVCGDSASKPSEVLNAKADIVEAEAEIPTWNMNLKAAEQELAAINRYMAELKPQCQYQGDDILEMAELKEEAEWRLELMARAENFMLSQGYIPHDQLNTMRNHPQFASAILPHIGVIENKLVENQANKLTGLKSRLQVIEMPAQLFLKG